MTLPLIERPASLRVQVQDAIVAHITQNNLQPGDPIPPETTLARTLGVSRNSVREAVKSLESLGLLETRRGIGVCVKSFSINQVLDTLHIARMDDLAELADLLELREVLETGMIAKAIDRVSLPAIEELRAILGRMRAKAEAGSPFAEEDRALHATLLRDTENRTLLTLLDLFWHLFSRTAGYADLTDDFPMQTYEDHVAIVDAVVAKDASRAREALAAHYSGIDARLRAAREQRA